MGAPKMKWSQEEESALRYGVFKHGPGRWRTILSDPEFSEVLFLRSNVDLKDKWRNISVMVVNGCGSHLKSKLAAKKMFSTFPSDEVIVDAITKCSPTTGSSALQVSSPMIPNWLDSLIMEAVYTMKEPGGSSETAIGNYIEERYEIPPNFKQLLSSKLKYLSACGTGKLIEVKRKYRIPNSTALSSHRKRPKPDRDEVSVQTQSEFDFELARMMIMNIHEAAAIAAQAVAEAEAAMAEADEAAKQAEEAEAEAEATQALAEEVSKSLKGGNSYNMICA